MNSLKLTTLTMLIPLGWAVSVDAYPDHLEEVGRARTLAPQIACGSTSPYVAILEDASQSRGQFRSEFDALLEHNHLIQRPVPRDRPTDTCRLDLDSQDIN